MVVGVLREPSFETRVSLLPDSVGTLVKKGVSVLVESGAGERSFNNDEEYVKHGAEISSAAEIFLRADLILSIHLPASYDMQPPASKVFIGVYQPLYIADKMEELARKGLAIFSLDMLPRTTRAQAMDVLSSQANIAGYKAVLLAAERYSRYFPMFMTAAGSIPPAKVLILGAGVAGLQAIATARRLGAVVEVFDTRPAVKEEVISLGGKFIEVEGAADASSAGGYAVEQSADFLEKQKQKIAESIAKADIVITTAQIPGKRAPLLVTAEMIRRMRSGSIIVDLAAATGGNTEATKNNETVLINGVSVIGNSALAASMPYDASRLYGKNVLNFLALIITKEGQLNLNFDDDLVKGCCITHGGEVVNEKVGREIKLKT
jgi:NAD(P) transhydrogenase subunit alpha